MGMYLPDGGHLSHGWSYGENKDEKLKVENDFEYLGGERKVNISSKIWQSIFICSEACLKMAVKSVAAPSTASRACSNC